MTETKEHRVIWQPHPGPQTEALTRAEDEILYGGARGGGKTDAGLAWMLEYIQNKEYKGLVIRKNADDLKDWIDRAEAMYKPLGGEWKQGQRQFVFKSGAKIRTGHLKDDSAYTKYQGHEYHKILIEELTHIPSEELYMKLISSCRSTVDGLQPQVFCTTNPGGIGHSRVKKRFVDAAYPGKTIYIKLKNGIRTRIFIPAKVEDNPTLIKKDPGYLHMLDSLPEELRKAWREGSWDVYDTKGAIFGKYMQETMKERRVCNGLYDANLDTYTFRDIGRDTTVILYVQFHGKEIRIVDCDYGVDMGLEEFVRPVKSKKYIYGGHIGPHDLANKELMTRDLNRQEYMKNHGIDMQITPRVRNKEDHIQILRVLFNKIWFEESKTEKLREAMMQYRKKRYEEMQTFGDPIHDRASHFADAMMQMAANYDKITATKGIQHMKKRPTPINPRNMQPIRQQREPEPYVSRMNSSNTNRSTKKKFTY